jgi:NAD(P)-dependent dehydrogenase (short-subunit alcohol dehydrogenase family)
VRSVVHALAYEEHRAAVDFSLESMLTSYRVGPLAAFGLFRAVAVSGSVAPGASFTAIGSLHERQPFRRCLGYNAAHAALGQVVRTLAHEWASRGLRVNAVVPGWIATPGEVALYGQDHLDAAASRLPSGSLGTVEQVAAAVAFVSSADAGYVSGSFLTVDGALGVSLARLPGEED